MLDLSSQQALSFAMLKGASILILMSFHSFALIGQTNNFDTVTVKNVDIKITVTAKPVSSTLKNEIINHQDYKKAYAYSDTKDKQLIAMSDWESNQYSSQYPDPTSNPILNKQTIVSKKGNELSKQVQPARKSSSKKNSYFLSSLILIITGTLLAAFYRSGIPLVLVILLLVAGYYILVYSLLFMA